MIRIITIKDNPVLTQEEEERISRIRKILIAAAKTILKIRLCKFLRDKILDSRTHRTMEWVNKVKLCNKQAENSTLAIEKSSNTTQKKINKV